MAATLGQDPDELAAELVRAVAQDLAAGKSPDKVVEGLAKGGLSREQAMKLVDVVVQARSRHENSAEGRAQKRSNAVSRMLQGALWSGGGLLITLMSMGSGGGRVFFGAVIYGGYLFISGLIVWGGNASQVGDGEELKKGPQWLREVQVGADAPRDKTPVRPPIVLPTKIASPAPAPRPVPAAATSRSSGAPTRAAPAALTKLVPRSAQGTQVTRIYAVAFLVDQVLGLAFSSGMVNLAFFGGLGTYLGVLSMVIFGFGLVCAGEVIAARLSYGFLVLPAYHLFGSVLMQQLDPTTVTTVSFLHSLVGLLGGTAWLHFTGQLTVAGTTARASHAND